VARSARLPASILARYPTLATHLFVVALAVGACVPAPAGRASPGEAFATDIPAQTSAPATAEPTPSGPTLLPSFVRPTLTPEPSYLMYTVRRGDTLLSIAARFGTTARSLAFWNRDTYPSLDPDSTGYAPNRIRIGWVLRLHPNVELDPDSLPEPSPASPRPSGSPASSSDGP